jgi:hypothetical protein
MHVHLPIEPTFDGRVTLDSWLAETTRQIGALLKTFADMPEEEIRSLGIDWNRPPLSST